jgi:hypothetical protein
MPDIARSLAGVDPFRAEGNSGDPIFQAPTTQSQLWISLHSRIHSKLWKMNKKKLTPDGIRRQPYSWGSW